MNIVVARTRAFVSVSRFRTALKSALFSKDILNLHGMLLRRRVNFTNGPSCAPNAAAREFKRLAVKQGFEELSRPTTGSWLLPEVVLATGIEPVTY